jgi:hypothetical protein
LAFGTKRNATASCLHKIQLRDEMSRFVKGRMTRKGLQLLVRRLESLVRVRRVKRVEYNM